MRCDSKIAKKVINNIEEKFGLLDDLNNKFTSVSPLPERDLNLNSLATKVEFKSVIPEEIGRILMNNCIR